MYVNKCIKCGAEFETKNPKRVICPNCLYADKGLFNSYATDVKIFGNLCVNRCNKKNMGGNTDIYYQSNHCRSSLLSMIRPIAKFDPTRYHVTFSSNVASFKFEKN